jgi:FkbM family methyltransferase
MAMLSYAQNGEDVILNRLFPEGGGFFIDVGANDPLDSSVTKHFYDRGWRGINVEPEPAAFARMVAGRPLDLNLNVGISDRRGILTFFDAPKANGWSTFSPGQAANLRAQGLEIIERPIQVTTLARVCEEHVDGPIQFLKIDVESHEAEVVAGADWSRWRPRVVLIESLGWVHWEPSLLAAGYHFALFDGINRFYVRDEDRDLLTKFTTMANFVDDFIPFAYLKVIQELQNRLEDAEKRLQALHPWSRNLEGFLRHYPRVHSLIGGGSRRAG